MTNQFQQQQPTKENRKDFSNVDLNNPESLINYLQYIYEEPYTNNITRKVNSDLGLCNGDKVLDVGCGYGKDLKGYHYRVGCKGEVVGIDNSTSMINHAKRQYESDESYSNIKLMVASADDIPFPASYFDVSRTERVMQHVPDPAKMLDEMIRVTKNGGLVSVTDTDWDSSRLYVPERLRSVRDRIFSARFNANPGMGSELFSMMNPRLERVKVRGIVLQATSFEFANRMLMLNERAKRAIEQRSITQEEYDDWLSTMIDLDKQGKFYHSANYISVRG
ncbi:hypothetical protein SAMD00019534_100010, partial [Acytostelium subglobosum LB1]|uniref:hypothetical protein n=1 Tax=Acytostelium subglobosum LB1 TaxID=1410327 RepID=UPI000644A2E9